MQCYGVLGTFSKGELRIVGNNKDFLRKELVEGDGKRLSEEVMQPIENNEVIPDTDALVKEEKWEVHGLLRTCVEFTKAKEL